MTTGTTMSTASSGRRAVIILTWTLAALSATLASGASAQTPDQEAWTARYQSTYNWQRHGAFRAAYDGANSLGAARDKMFTFSATAHWGMRLWQGAELYFNPELASGVPFSASLVGLGGFTNGEITRATGSQPKPYVQRLFVRQTWNQGGGTEKLDSDFNQMAGSVDTRRVVLTLGNFSTLDVFDENTYAKDPRTQFMNWGNWTYAAFDYAADARGFGWGFAVEWYQDAWVLRAGRMTGPRVPNGLQVDFALGRHYGDQVELERAHSLAGQPGKVRLLAWRNRGVLARLRDATDYLMANPGTDPQSFFKVRQGERIKYGLGLNVEQALGRDVGYFLRAMKADGRTETHAFTEVDDSLSTGVLIRGGSWGRAGDTVGVSFMRNGLSKDRRNFLAAGGVSFFIGDGALDYRPERIVEVFYSIALHERLWLTADFQHIRNPAYNAARGPLSVLALRLHAEF